VAQEAVGGDLELEVIAASVPLGALDVSDEHLVLGVGRGERPEVVLAGDQLGSVGDAMLLERPRLPPAEPLLER
jgi:hypothetical protein